MSNAQLEKAKINADNMAARDGKKYVVVDVGGCYQIWPAVGFSRDHVYVAGEVAPANEWDDLLS